MPFGPNLGQAGPNIWIIMFFLQMSSLRVIKWFTHRCKESECFWHKVGPGKGSELLDSCAKIWQSSLFWYIQQPASEIASPHLWRFQHQGLAYQGPLHSYTNIAT